MSVYGSGNTINQGSEVNKASVNVPQDIRSPAAEIAQVRNNYVFLRPPASNVDNDAEIERIRIVESGVGATPDISRAFQMYRNAAKLGNVQANVEIGRLLLELNTRVAAMQAYELFALAAKKGNADALAWQAWLHDSRQIDIASHSTAVDLYKKASENGSAWAAFKMGIAH